MTTLAQPSPSWIASYLPDFEGVLRVVTLSSGFMLLPVEVLGPDLARALGAWLGSRGHPALVMEPLDDAEWRDLAGALLRAEPPPGGVVMVLGGRLQPEGLFAGLRIVNEQRDTIAKRLACPLLWCGPASFLLLTRDRAPDFWSVRAVERRLSPAPAGTELLEEAKRQGDVKSTGMLTLQRARALLEAGEPAEAATLLDEAAPALQAADPPMYADALLLQAELARQRGDLGAALAALDRVPPGGDAPLRCRVHLCAGRVYETAGALARASREYSSAHEEAGLATDPALLALTSVRWGALQVLTGEAPEAALRLIDDGRDLATKSGDLALVVLATRLLAGALSRTLDQGRAARLLAEAQALAARAEGRPSVVVPGELEEPPLLEQRGMSLVEIDQEIRELRRALRVGGQLREGDALGDGRYVLERRLGRGGFATVWEAHDERRGERVAIKVLHPYLTGDATRLERFFRSARTMAALEHEAVVRVLEPHGQEDGWHYFVMELLPGGDLRQMVLARSLDGRSLDETAVLDILLQVGSALEAAHSRGLLHRDVKPSNILFDAAGAPKLTDFDLAAAADTSGGTRSGAMGTFLYAAPETMTPPQAADARADVYGLAMTAVFALYGRELPMAVLRAPERLIEGLACSPGVKAALQKGVAWKPDERYPSVAAFCAALRGPGDLSGQDLRG